MNSNAPSRFRTAPSIFTRRQSSNSTAVPGAEVLDQRLKKFNPIDCAGVWLGKSKMGSGHCWEATGAVREMFKKISRDILEQLGGTSEPGDPIVAWSIYIIGKTKSTAVPTLLFICDQRTARKDIRARVEESCILAEYPTVRVGDCSKPPDFGKVSPLESLLDGERDQIKMLASSEGHEDTSLRSTEIDSNVFIRPSDRLCGSRIYGANMRAATAGASFQLQGRYYITTVDHVFTPHDDFSSVDPNDDDSGSEFEFENSGEEPGIASNIEIEDSEMAGGPLSLHPSAENYPITTDELSKLGKVIFAAKDAGSPGIDFSLIEIDERYIKENDGSIFAGLPSYTAIKNQIASEPAGGNQLFAGQDDGDTYIHSMPGGVGFQEVWTVTFNGQLTLGDCGSLVTGLNGDQIYGHIIAGSPISSVAYIVPAAQTFDCLDDYLAQSNSALHANSAPDVQKMPINGMQVAFWPQHPSKHPAGGLYEPKRPVTDNLTRQHTNGLAEPPNEKSTTSPEYPSVFPTPESTHRKDFWREGNIVHEACSPGSLPEIWEDTASPYELDVLANFLRDTRIQDVEDGTGEAATLRAAWLDHRSGVNPKIVGIREPIFSNGLLSATGLLRALKAPHFKGEMEPDAEPHVKRRLIYISDLSPYFIHTLAIAAPLQEIDALRSAICAHVSCRASMVAKVSSAGPPTFQLEFHLPFFHLRKYDLRESRDVEKSLLRSKMNSRGPKRWIDPSLLKLQSTHYPGSDDQGSNDIWSLHKYQYSMVITGTEHRQWTVYSFRDTNFDDRRDDYSTVDRHNFGPIPELDTGVPIWSPREYFLNAVRTRTKEVKEEWEYLIFKLDSNLRQYKPENSFVSSRGRVDPMKTRFDWCRQRLDLLSELADVLGETVSQFKSFCDPDGDILYFHDTGGSAISPDAHRWLRDIKRTFRRLESFHKKILSSRENCRSDISTLKLVLSLEGNAATEQSAFTAKFTIWVLCPFVLAAGMFSMQPSVIPFDLTFRWFILTMLLLTFMMFIIQWTMKRFHLFKKKVAFYLKLRTYNDLLNPDEKFMSCGYSQLLNGNQDSTANEPRGKEVMDV
ncbi:hypothetical protein L207DRAFT_633602 [Hyaloscypha variabilis F]|uniref:Uncharacterized protein n=1 Tax=Hyaloscypha variabilis (strain UAMH 11265 / GT02V1 / F) TaxID=1149755 RepID=A0A2J6RQ26_HYAVF|nr:hypothetical protein L207DRAFT_633602 [Hyaloscypha variabilis F]